MEKIGEDNQKVGKIGRIINQMPIWGPKHDKIWAWWASSIPSESMLKRVWWCKHSEMKSWRWTICYLMNCSKGRSVATLTLGSQPKQGLARVWVKREARECGRVWEWTLTLPSELPFWELESRWTPKFFKKWLQVSKPIALRSFLYHWKFIKT
jgi:hypothetical protein